MNSLLKQMTPEQFHTYFADGKHTWLERMDSQKNWSAIEAWLTQPGQSSAELDNRKAFMKFHIKMTASVFGKWNWTKREERNAAIADEWATADGRPFNVGNRWFKCCLCDEQAKGWGNNPQPLMGGKCCDECNMTKVIPARMMGFTKADLAKDEAEEAAH
jgi:hypothetical protein